MKFKVNKKMLLQEDAVVDALLHNGGTGEELPNKSVMDTIKETLPSMPHFNISDKLTHLKNNISDFAYDAMHGQNALGGHAIDTQNRDNVLNKTGIDINNSLYTDPEKLHQNLSNAVPPKEPLKTIFNDPNAQIDNLQSHVAKYENTIDALKQQNAKAEDTIANQTWNNSEKDDKIEALKQQNAKAEDTIANQTWNNSEKDDKIEALKHPYGDKFLGSQTIANKLNNMTLGQQLATAAGTGAILGTGGHILGSTLSKRLRGADKK